MNIQQHAYSKKGVLILCTTSDESWRSAGGESGARPSEARVPGKPKSALKSFALALPDAEEPEQQLSSAKSMRARSKRVSSVATSLLKGLQVTCQPHGHCHSFTVRDMLPLQLRGISKLTFM